MRRTTLVTAMATGVALVLTACGGGGSSNSGADSGEVTFWDTSGPNESPVFKKLAEDCATKGGYKVKVETQAFDTALANYKTAAQGGQGGQAPGAQAGGGEHLVQPLVAQAGVAASALELFILGTTLATNATG